MKQKILLISGLALSLLFAACSVGDKDEKATDKKSFSTKVKTVKAIMRNQNEELILTGKVEYNPDKVMNYVPLVSGVVSRTYFSLGDKVRKGQSLLDIRSSDLSELQSSYSTAIDEIEIAERELKTAQSMFEDNMTSEKELLEAKARLRQAQANLNKMESDMAVYGSNKGGGVFSVQAPMNGYIVGKSVSSGSTVSSDSEPIFTIADLSSVWITANVYANNLRFVQEGMTVHISLISYPDKLFTGKITQLSQVFDAEEKVLKARIEMPNPELKFKPEMSAVIKLLDEKQTEYISIPSDALIFDSDRYFVVVQEGEDFQVKKVELQGHHNQMSYIASGLSEGENVVVQNQLLIYSSLKETI